MTTQLIQSIGWTLIHSLWQGLAIFIVLKIATRLTNRSDLRYAMGVASMGLMAVASVITFTILNQSTTYNPLENGVEFVLAANTSTNDIQAESFMQTAMHFINQNIIWLLRFWVLGFGVGLVRIAAGLWYIKRLRNTANPVSDEWMSLVNRLSESLNVSGVVTMAEASISSPMVVGFVKPVILFPVGLLSGLSVEQVETILVHELSHIRRQDYIINLVQSMIETIYFFNPFVLLMSAFIREERENCCDDIVIAKGISPISYVKTLAQLEASRSSSKLALGFAGNQNQLLNRIKRIMENSAKNDWGKSRFVPVALLALGLICASWLSINTEAEAQKIKKDAKKDDTRVSKYTVHDRDTSREDGLIVIKRGSGYNTWMVEPAEPSFDVPVPEIDFAPEFEMPEIPEMPEIDFQMPELAAIPEIAEIPEIFFNGSFDQSFYFDSIPGINAQMAKMHADLAKQMAVQAEVMANQARISAVMQNEQMSIMEDQMRLQEEMFRDMAERSNEYNKELIDMLVKDGYVTADEVQHSININDNNGELVINGHKIKEKDAVKYRALHDKYFERINKRTKGRSE